jgi:uncharacterized protein with NRDE domain
VAQAGHFKATICRSPASASGGSRFFELLADEEIVPDSALPTTGVPLEWERRLSAVFVRSPDYGTRASTLLTVDTNGAGTLVERGFGPAAKALGEVRLKLSC